MTGKARRVAAIDCGTNSIRLLVAEGLEGGVREVDRGLHLTRLGQGVDATGAFAPEALERTMTAVDDYAARIGAAGVGVRDVRFVATSAARDAANSEEFFSGVRERLGVEAEIIPGREEARLSFVGALSAARDIAWPALVVDIGGGSTELVLGESDADARVSIITAVSLDMGAVRLRERFLRGDPPAASELADATAFVDQLLDSCGVDFSAARTWLAVGGAATCLAAINLGLERYDRSRVHGAMVSRAQGSALASRLAAMTVAEVAALPTMQPRRADVIGAGALINARIGVRCLVDERVSEADILDGIVLDLLARA